MPEIREEIKIILVRYTCDKCSKGEMTYSGRTFKESPVKYSHRCNTCGASELLGSKYPHPEKERANNEIRKRVHR